MTYSLIDPPSPFHTSAEWESFLKRVTYLPEKELAEMLDLAKEAEETRAALGIS